MLQQRVDQHGQQRAVWHHPHQVRGHRGARICQVTNIFNILLQVTAAATLSVSPRHDIDGQDNLAQNSRNIITLTSLNVELI